MAGFIDNLRSRYAAATVPVRFVMVNVAVFVIVRVLALVCLLFAVDAYIWGPLRLGWSFRYRMKLAQSDMGANSLWYIPGFGENGNKLGGTFNIIFELGRKNKKTL